MFRSESSDPLMSGGDGVSMPVEPERTGPGVLVPALAAAAIGLAATIYGITTEHAPVTASAPVPAAESGGTLRCINAPVDLSPDEQVCFDGNTAGVYARGSTQPEQVLIIDPDNKTGLFCYQTRPEVPKQWRFCAEKAPAGAGGTDTGFRFVPREPIPGLR